MSEESLENKIKDFELYLSKEKSQKIFDLKKIQFMEIQAYVVQYQAKNQNNKNSTQQNNKNKTKPKNSLDDEDEPDDLWGDFDDLITNNDNYYDERSSIIQNELSLQEIKKKKN